LKVFGLGKRKSFAILITVFLVGFAFGVYVGYVRGIPFIGKRFVWSIGVYVGSSPFDLSPPKDLVNPVLTAEDVTDVDAEYVADPFMVFENGTWYMFFEVMNSKTHQGDIGLAVSSDGFHWTYKRIVLDEPFHLSYPYVFKWGKRYYMIPETGENCSVRLYEAAKFPTEWRYVKTLLYGCYLDPSIIHYNDTWWLFVYSGEGILRLFYARNLTGPWIEHPMSPIVKCNCSVARPGGRLIVFRDHVIRFAQDDSQAYGVRVYAFEVIELTAEKYAERWVPGNPVLEPNGSGWNAGGMHNVDAHQLGDGGWIGCVDGYRVEYVFGLGY